MRRSILIPGQAEPAAVLAVYDLDLRVSGEEAFQIAPGGHPHPAIELATQGAVLAALHTVEFNVPAQRFATEVHQGRLAGASPSDDHVEPGVQGDPDRRRTAHVPGRIHYDTLDDESGSQLVGIERITCGGIS